MGRDAKLARSLGADNRGNRGRLVVAHGTCNQVLCADLRVVEHYRLLVAAHEAWRTDSRAAFVRRFQTVAQMEAAVARADIEALAGVLRGIGVPWRWCAEALVHVYFPTMRHNAQHPDNPRVIQVSAGIRGLAAGQAPPHDGQEIAENVRWWYRRHIKSPRDSIHALAEEWATRENRVTDSRSVVQTGIKRAELLLNGVITR